MSAAEDDTELRDLLLQNLENSGVLHKLKAQMRAAVFLAMEEQDRIQNKTPLVNETLKNSLNTKDGRVVAGLVMDFLRVFDLDFTLAVFEPEITSKQLESREALCKDLGLDPNSKNPVLLELVQTRRQEPNPNQTKDRTTDRTSDQEPSLKQLESVRRRFDVYNKDGSGSVNKDDVKAVFFDLFPKIHRNVLEKFVLEELRATDLLFSRTCDWASFLLLYQRLFSQCRSVVEECGEPEDRISPINKVTGDQAKVDSGLNPVLDSGLNPVLDSGLNPVLDLDQGDDGDSFFDDPLPAPQKTYGWKPESPVPSLSLGRSSSSEPSKSGASKPKGKVTKDKSGSHHHQDEDVEYDDDFNSHRSDLSHSEVSIGEEIEEVSIEGPSDKFDESTQDLSVSQISHTADYLEDVP